MNPADRQRLDLLVLGAGGSIQLDVAARAKIAGGDQRIGGLLHGGSIRPGDRHRFVVHVRDGLGARHR